MDEYEPTQAGRAIEEFVDAQLSNWYVRLCRRRFWKGEYEQDKISAYQTLYECLETIVKLIAPVSPFFADYYFQEPECSNRKASVTNRFIIPCFRCQMLSWLMLTWKSGCNWHRMPLR